MFAKIDMVLKEKPDALTVPRDAVLKEGGKEFVFAVEGNQAIRKPVVTGIEQETLVEIVEGVKDGDKVVVRGQESLKDRSTVRIIEGS